MCVCVHLVTVLPSREAFRQNQTEQANVASLGNALAQRPVSAVTATTTASPPPKENLYPPRKQQRPRLCFIVVVLYYFTGSKGEACDPDRKLRQITVADELQRNCRDDGGHKAEGRTRRRHGGGQDHRPVVREGHQDADHPVEEKHPLGLMGPRKWRWKWVREGGGGGESRTKQHAITTPIPVSAHQSARDLVFKARSLFDYGDGVKMKNEAERSVFRRKFARGM